MDDSLYCVGDEPLCDKEKNYYVLILHLMELLFLLQTYIQEMPKIKKNSTLKLASWSFLVQFKDIYALTKTIFKKERVLE